MCGDKSSNCDAVFSSLGLRRILSGWKLRARHRILPTQSVCCQTFAGRFQHLMLGLCCAVALGPLGTLRASTFYLEGDAIGPDSSTTDDTGGFTAVEQDGENLGQPAISVSLGRFDLLREFRVIVFGVSAANGNLLFDDFQYNLDLWKFDDYFADAEPEYEVDLGDPVGIELVANGATEIVPSVPFGTAGVAGGGATTYDFRFDLTDLPIGGPSQDLFTNPLEPGDWVIGFQSSHDTSESGILRVSGSVATEGPLPLFSRDSVPRGVLNGQDPNDIAVRWGITLGAEIAIPGDFDHDLDVDGDDGAIWNVTYGVEHIADADDDGDVDGTDFLAWQANFGMEGAAGDLPGDFIPNGFVDADDLVAWSATYGAGPFGDADNDKDVDGSDFLFWQRMFGTGVSMDTIPGDFNLDGVVDGEDLAVWEAAFGTDGGADADEDGDSDGVDFLFWQRNFGTGVNAVAANTVPEPTGSILLLFGVLGYRSSRLALR